MEQNNYTQKNIFKMTFFILVISIVFLSHQVGSHPTQLTSTVYLVRHAEKDLSIPNRKDPPLTQQGKKRALDLAQFFKDIPLDEVYSTDYKRTRDTALPTAKYHHLKLKIYRPRQLNMKELHSKTTLIVGHSNTIPKLVNQLIGQKIYQKIHEDDYTHIYQVIVHQKLISHSLFHK